MEAKAEASDAIILGRIQRFENGKLGELYKYSNSGVTTTRMCLVLIMEGTRKITADQKSGLYAIRWPSGKRLKGKLSVVCTKISGFSSTQDLHVIKEFSMQIEPQTIYLVPTRNLSFSDWNTTKSSGAVVDRSKKSNNSILQEFFQAKPEYKGFAVNIID
jgi:hypothetical protein